MNTVECRQRGRSLVSASRIGRIRSWARSARFAAVVAASGATALDAQPGYSFPDQLGRQTIYTFEDLAGQGMSPIHPNPYFGIQFDQNWWAFSTPQKEYIPRSGVVRLANNLAGTGLNVPSSFSFASPVILVGAYFSGGFEVWFSLYSGGVHVANSTVLNLDASPNHQPVFLSSGYSGPVDRVDVMAGSHGTGFISMDDLAICTPAIARPICDFQVVPEPSTFALLGCGISALVAIAGGSRRRRTRV